jgi:hypothetical protein
MPNQLPQGDIFAVGTPYLDRLSNRLYAHQQLLEQQRMKELQSLDDDFKKSITNIRSADIPEFTKAYNDYRMARISQLRKPATDRNEYFQQQQDVNQKLANAYSLLNDSVTEKAREKDLATKIHGNWKNYTDNASDWLKTRMGVPTSQLSTFTTKDEKGNPITYDSEEPILYKGGFDFSKDIKNAYGVAQKDLGTIDETKDPKSIQKTIGKYKGYNSPFAAYSQLVSSLADPRKANSFIKTHQFSPEVEQQIENRFNSIVSNPTYQHLYGLTGDEIFPADDTELGHAAKMAVMLALTPPSREEVLKTDEKAKMDYGKDIAFEKMDKADKIAMKHIWYNASLQGKSGGNYNVSELQLPDGSTDLTKPLQGINVNNIVTGKAFKSDNIKYDPTTKQITYNDVVDNKEYTIPAQKFRQIISTINTVQDLKIYDNLIQGIDKAYTKPKTSSTPKNRPPLSSFLKK